ncbi:MAG: MFS transporter, partial [Planctomycetota bacterium]
MSEGQEEHRGRPPFMGVTRNILVAGIVSFFMDVSSEMVYAVAPQFLTALGASAGIIGLIEGFAEGTASIFKLLSGVMADRARRYKPLVTVGYLVSALSRPFVATARGAGQVFGGRVMDRFGKGVRTAPRDTIIAASADKRAYGKAFGFHRAMDQAGAVVGPALAFIVLFVGHRRFTGLGASAFRPVIWISLLPALLAVAATLFLRETGRRAAAAHVQGADEGDETGGTRRYFYFLGVMLVFSLGNSSNAFILLRADDLGMAPSFIPLAYATMNVVHSCVSIPWGILADRIGFKRVILIGFGVYVATYICLAEARAVWMMWGIFAVYGLFESAFEGQSRAYLARIAKKHLRGTSFGLYHAVLSASVLFASLIAGLLWDWDHPLNANRQFPFYFGAALAAAAFVMLAVEPLVFGRG